MIISRIVKDEQFSCCFVTKADVRPFDYNVNRTGSIFRRHGHQQGSPRGLACTGRATEQEPPPEGGL